MDAQSNRRKRLNELLETAKGRTYFVLFVTFAFTAVMVLFGILPSYSAFAKQAEQNGLRADFIINLQAKLSILESLVLENQSKAAIKGTFNVIMPNDFNQLNYIQEVSQTAAKHGMLMVDVKFSDTNDFGDKLNALVIDPNLRAISMIIHLEGDKESIGNYVADMESSIRIYNISEVTIVKKTEEELLLDNTRPYKYTLTAQTYFFTTKTYE
jgi:Tfp pilus assembly protein PilO